MVEQKKTINTHRKYSNMEDKCGDKSTQKYRGQYVRKIFEDILSPLDAIIVLKCEITPKIREQFKNFNINIGYEYPDKKKLAVVFFNREAFTYTMKGECLDGQEWLDHVIIL